ncbi:MAG TPA: alpha/beta hydrolase [Roseiflexaceae bacterium]|nr:alpha/beta hydrolase [Roseiflexaceae bacterium]
MRTVLRGVLFVAVLCLVLPLAAPARARPAQLPPAAIPGPCQDDVLPSGAKSKICVPVSGWNDDLVVYAHGYVAFNQPIDFQNLTFGGVDLPTAVQIQGYAFATTSYRQNGLAVLEGADDIRELIAAFKATRTPDHIYLIGVSEGALVATLLAEQSPELISGALAACGPIGSFQRQIEYFADFRVVFDYFFPGVLPGSPINIPNQLIDNWESTYAPAVANALQTSPISATQLISVTQAPIDPADPAVTTISTTLDILWYNVFATNDAVAKLGGNPYGNAGRVYAGSADDARLNAQVQRFNANSTALNALAAYETGGQLRLPLVTLHTIGDDVIPFWHEQLYRDKVPEVWRFNLTQLPSPSYGHCNFTTQEAQVALLTLVQQVNTPERARVYLPIVLRP